MSFYWQNAVPQESGQSTGSTWDNINLGGSPAQQNQTVQPAQQSFSYENQQVRISSLEVRPSSYPYHLECFWLRAVCKSLR